MERYSKNSQGDDENNDYDDEYVMNGEEEEEFIDLGDDIQPFSMNYRS
jgi:hypothetical protein